MMWSRVSSIKDPSSWLFIDAFFDTKYWVVTPLKHLLPAFQMDPKTVVPESEVIPSGRVIADMKKEEAQASVGIISMDESEEKALVRRIDLWWEIDIHGRFGNYWMISGFFHAFGSHTPYNFWIRQPWDTPLFLVYRRELYVSVIFGRRWFIFLLT